MPSSCTDIKKYSVSWLTVIVIVPPSNFDRRPCLTEFSIIGCKIRAGTLKRLCHQFQFIFSLSPKRAISILIIGIDAAVPAAGKLMYLDQQGFAVIISQIIDKFFSCLRLYAAIIADCI